MALLKLLDGASHGRCTTEDILLHTTEYYTSLSRAVSDAEIVSVHQHDLVLFTNESPSVHHYATNSLHYFGMFGFIGERINRVAGRTATLAIKHVPRWRRVQSSRHIQSQVESSE